MSAPKFTNSEDALQIKFHRIFKLLEIIFFRMNIIICPWLIHF